MLRHNKMFRYKRSVPLLFLCLVTFSSDLHLPARPSFSLCLLAVHESRPSHPFKRGTQKRGSIKVKGQSSVGRWATWEGALTILRQARDQSDGKQARATEGIASPCGHASSAGPCGLASSAPKPGLEQPLQGMNVDQLSLPSRKLPSCYSSWLLKREE